MGSSGTKPCIKCKNIVGKVCKVDDPYFYKLTHPNIADCHQVTNAEIWDAVDTLAIKKNEMRVSDAWDCTMFQHVFGQCHSTETNFHCPMSCSTSCTCIMQMVLPPVN